MPKKPKKNEGRIVKISTSRLFVNRPARVTLELLELEAVLAVIDAGYGKVCDPPYYILENNLMNAKRKLEKWYKKLRGEVRKK